MSEQKKVPGAFPTGTGVRDAIPTADEGDALLDMLFDDAPRESNGGEPAGNAAPPQGAPLGSAEATPIPGALPPTKPPPPPEPPRPPPASGKVARGEVVTPPGWATTPSGPASTPRGTVPTLPEPDMDDVATRAFSHGDASDYLQEEGRRVSALDDFSSLSEEEDAEDGRTVVAPNVVAAVQQYFASAAAAERPVDEIVEAEEEEIGFVEPSFEPEPDTTTASDREPAFGAGPALSEPELAEPELSGLDLGDVGIEGAVEAPVLVEPGLVEPAEEDVIEEISAEQGSQPAPDGLVVSLSARPPADADLTDEEEAPAFVAQTPGMRETFLERSRWMREEANAATDKLQRARLLLVVSETLAMIGEHEEALEAAREAHQLAPSQPLVSRQLRAALLRSGEIERARDVLETEIRHSPTTEGRAHAGWVGAEMARLLQRDGEAAHKLSEQAMRALPADPRPSVQRFIEAAAELPDPSSLAKLKPAEPESLAALGTAFSLVATLRGAPSRVGAEPRHIVEAAIAARAAIAGGDPQAMVAGVARLRDTSFRAGGCWLTAVLAAPHEETRGEAIASLREIAPHSNLARRSLAALCVEMQQAVDPRDPNAFAPLDRVALAALDAARPASADLSAGAGLASRGMLTSILDDAAVATNGTDESGAVAQLSGPIVAALLPTGEQRLSRLKFAHGGSHGARAAALLGRVLASIRSTGVEAHEAIDAALSELVQSADVLRPSWSALVRALQMELDIDSSAADRVAQTIATWGSDGERPTDAGGVLVAALLAELSRDAESARASYGEIHREDPSSEAVARAASGDGEVGTPAGSALAKMLREHAEQLPAGPRRAILFTECAIRFASLAQAARAEAEGGESAEADELSEQAEQCAKAAAELAPELPLAAHLGELGARARGDQSSLVDWLRYRREVSEDPIEKAHDLTREALLVSDGESTAASSLLEAALRARPNDFCLRELYERLSPEPTSDRATWREARLSEVGPREASRLAIEAALEYERAGDLEAAARAAKLAEEHGEHDLAPIAAYRFALAGFGTAELVESLLPIARDSEDAALRLETYERLAELDERGRDDAASGLLFRRAILEEKPSHLRTLRRVASALMAGGRSDELEPFAMELARNLEGGEAVAYAALAARLRPRWEDTAEPVAIAYAQSRPLWAIRQMSAHARARNDHSVAAQCDRELMAMTDRPSERATLAVRAAQALRHLDDLDTVSELLGEAISLVPEHIIARLELASVLETAGQWASAASQVESAAQLITDPAWRLELDMTAALIWQDRAGEPDRAREALERIATADPHNAEAFERLQKIYVAAGARAELAELLGRRIDSIEDPGERVEMEVMRGRALAEVGDAESAKRALAAALDANPDHVEALQSFANLCFSDGDYEGAEQALIRLARLTSEPERQVAIYLQLGELYDDSLPNDERAELAYQEVLKRIPTDERAREKLIALYRRVGQMARAVEEQNVLVNGAENPDDKCQRTVELAEILEESGELKKAESTLVVARKAFPKSDAALRALVLFYQRSGQAPAAAILLDRAVADARRALGTGRFETFLFETLATAAELRNRQDAAHVARAAVQAIEGETVALAGVEGRAGDAALDELLAPEVMTPAFRDLLQRTGPLLDSAFPYDLEAVRAMPAPGQLPISAEVRAIAGAYGLPQIQLLVSSVLGQVCVPARSHPPVIVMGQALASQDESPERTFLIHRAMKVIQANAAVFARTAPIDLWPLLAAYLRLFNPQFSPQGVDAGRFSEAFSRLSRMMPQGLGHDVSVLAADVIGTIGNRASTLNAAVNGWGSRAGLLGVGDLNVALTAIAWAGGNANGPPPSGKDRLTWIGRNAEARDLVIFSVSDAYVDARARLGAQ
ncbi:MAG: hypothetical protein HOW73_46050 [Polyangiaceae bacterium]|nr:hypothetical protein [Polyangiaceae bacterium]